MRSFFKIFFAALLAFVVFNVGVLLFLIGLAGAASSGDEVSVKDNSFLGLNLNRPIVEMAVEDPFQELNAAFSNVPAPLSLKAALEARSKLPSKA